MREQQIADSLAMLDAFASVGVKRFNLVQTSIDREQMGYRPGRNVGAMKLILPVFVPLVWELRQNLIVRPWDTAGAVLAQLDDLDAEKLELVRSVAFLVVETSPGNHQAWLSVAGGTKEFVKRLMRGVQADVRANASGRIAGSPNCKQAYAPNFPAVKIADMQRGCIVKPDELEKLGLVAPIHPAGFSGNPENMRAPLSSNRGWPDYERCLQGAPEKKDGTRDRSSADFLWSKWALERGNAPAAVMGKLLQLSEKAKQEWDHGNEKYVSRTVESAGRAVR